MLEYVLGSRGKRVVVPSLCNVLVGETDITQIVRNKYHCQLR